jgi:hypothetical protein
MQKHMMTAKRFFSLSFLLALCAGCGGTATVSGTVSYDGKPVVRGRLAFLPLDAKGELDGKAPIVSVEISQGTYTARDVPMGKKKVAVTASEIKGISRPPDKAASLIPPEAASNLTEEINKPQQTADFALKKPEKRLTESGKE